MTQWQGRIGKLAIVFFSLTLTAAFLPASAPAKEVIKIGVLLPFTGPMAFGGNEVFKGYEVARIEQNKKGGLFGKEIEFVKGDGIDAKVAVSEAERLITVEGVKIILGTFSSVLSFAASTVAEKNKVIYWETGSVADKITERGYKYLFRFCPPATKLAQAAARFGTVIAPEMLKVPIKDWKVAVIGEDSSYGKSVCETVKDVVAKSGAQLVAYEFYDANTKDLSSLILRLKSKAPDALIPTSYINDGILLHRQMRQLGLNVKVFVGTGNGHNTDKLKEAVGNDVNGVLCAGMAQPDDQSRVCQRVPQLPVFVQGPVERGHSIPALFRQLQRRLPALESDGDGGFNQSRRHPFRIRGLGQARRVFAHRLGNQICGAE